MNATVSDFTEAERELVTDLLQQRYSKRVLPELADSELKLDPASDDMTICPTLYWTEHGVNFVLCKVALGRYRCQFFYADADQFFYADADQYGMGHDDYTDLQRCVLTLLRVQADQKAQSAGIASGATAVDGLIPELELERVFGIKPGTLFSS